MIAPDRVTAKQRSAIMASVKGKNTSPELLVRTFAHRLGFRFRLHCIELPGRPDIVFPRLKKVIFVNGCFWHAHQCVRGKRIPANNRKYWIAKRRRNHYRDIRVSKNLKTLGWDVLTVWECEIKQLESLEHLLREFLVIRRKQS